MGVGAVAMGLSTGSNVVATEHTPLYFETVALEGDFVVIGNAGDEDFDLSGYIIDWEYNQQEDQTDEIPDGIVVPANGTVKLASGYDEAEAEDADHDFDYEDGRIRDDGSDTIAIHEPEMSSVVITSDDHQDPPEDPDDGADDDTDDDDTEDDDAGTDDDDTEDVDDETESDDRPAEDKDDRETEPEEEKDADDCPEEEGEKAESDDDECPEEEPEPEPKEEDC